ncbi:MAG: hypothetical protein AAB408_03835 [Patescibacteria group bacterium]
MYLLFDLSQKDILHLALFNEATIIHTRVPGRNRELLAVLDDFLKNQKATKQEIKGIMVVVGTGGFTNTRIACVVANTWAYAQKIPLLAIMADQVENIQQLIPLLLSQPVGQYISATYSGVPNITIPKKTS